LRLDRPAGAVPAHCRDGGAEAVQTTVTVAEGTGGGWGSICSADLYPTIEAIVIGAIGKSSPYKLEGFIDGKAVQPIAATLKVAVQVCQVAGEYPTCASGTEMRVCPARATTASITTRSTTP